MSHHIKVIENDLSSFRVIVDSGDNLVVLVSDTLYSYYLSSKNCFCLLDTGYSLNFLDRHIGQLLNILDNVVNFHSFGGHDNSWLDCSHLFLNSRSNIISSVGCYLSDLKGLFVNFHNNNKLLGINLDDLLDLIDLRIFNNLDDIYRLFFDHRVVVFNIFDAGLNSRNFLN